MAKKIALFISILTLSAFYACAQYVVEQFVEATPYGGYGNFRYFVSMEMVYPRKELHENRNEQVILGFKVLENGKVANLQVLAGENKALQEEALRLVRLVLWKPALEYQVPVESNVKLRIPFNTKKYRRWVQKRGYDELPNQLKNTEGDFRIYVSDQIDEETKPILPDGYTTLDNYLSRQLNYPAAAYRGNIQGMVRTRFVVEPDGVVSNLHALHPLGGGCTEEAFRLLRSIRWQAAKLNGLSVRSWVEIDISFTLN